MKATKPPSQQNPPTAEQGRMRESLRAAQAEGQPEVGARKIAPAAEARPERDDSDTRHSFDHCGSHMHPDHPRAQMHLHRPPGSQLARRPA